ncbi:MAG: hypothetical protein AB8B68_01460 [Rickettsiaceae bacterium]
MIKKIAVDDEVCFDQVESPSISLDNAGDRLLEQLDIVVLTKK